MTPQLSIVFLSTTRYSDLFKMVIGLPFFSAGISVEIDLFPSLVVLF